MFSGNDEATPRYEYNQIMYKLDLADPRLILPVAVYGNRDDEDSLATLTARKDAPTRGPIRFFALERPGEGAVPVYTETTGQGGLRVGKTGETPGEKPLFFALPVDAKESGPTTLPLFRISEQGPERGVLHHRHDCESDPATNAAEQPLCRVWRNPSSVGSSLE